MQKLNIDAINKIKLSAAKTAGAPFSLLWVHASEYQNRDTQNRRYHHHAFFEIHCVLSGTISYEFKERTLSARAGEYVVIPPHHPHRVESLSDDFCKLTVAFDINGQEYPSSSKAWVADISDEISDVVSLISKYSAEKHEYSKELITLWLQAAVYIVMSNSSYKLHSEKVGESYDTRFLKAKKYIEDNYDVFFSCEEIAEYCRLSVKQLGRLFLQYEGVGLSEFIRKTKLDAAKRMLVSSEKSQKKISEELGFSSVSYFNKFFMKWEGVSPGEFKKRNV